MNITEWVEQLADADTSAEIDWARMQRLLRSVGYPRAVVTMGVAYLDGRGTMANPPRSIHAVAQQLRPELTRLASVTIQSQTDQRLRRYIIQKEVTTMAYNKQAVQAEIDRDTTIGKGEAKLIHGLLKGRSSEAQRQRLVCTTYGCQCAAHEHHAGECMGADCGCH